MPPSPSLVLVVVTLDRRNLRADARYGVGLNLVRVVRNDGLGARGEAQIEREVADDEGAPVRTEGRARREEQALRHAIPVDAVEIAELGERLAGGINDDDLVALIGADPDIALAVDSDAIGAVDAVGQHGRRAGGTVRIDRH